MLSVLRSPSTKSSTSSKFTIGSRIKAYSSKATRTNTNQSKNMGGKIDCYVDCTSPYSWAAFDHIRKNRDLLAQYDVKYEFHPIFLGAIMHTVKNTPPAAVPARGKYLMKYDLRRVFEHHGLVKNLRVPDFFPMKSLGPQRCLLTIKNRHPQDKFEAAYESAWTYVFGKHVNISEPEGMKKWLSDHFDDKEVKAIMEQAVTQENKDAVNKLTNDVIENKGAYGAPWMWLTNSEGKSEPVFGSDRWQYVYDFLGVKYTDIEIAPRVSKL